MTERLAICLNHNYGGTHKVVAFEGVTGPVLDEWFNSLCSFYPEHKVLYILSGASAGAIIGALKLSGYAERLPAFWRMKVLPQVSKSLGPKNILAKLPGIVGQIPRDVGLFRARQEIAMILRDQLHHDLILSQPLIIFTTLREDRSPYIFYTGDIPEWFFGDIPCRHVDSYELLESALDASANTFSYYPTVIDDKEFIDGMFAVNPTVTHCIEKMALQAQKHDSLMFLSLTGPYNPKKKRGVYYKFGEESYKEIVRLKDKDGIIRMPGVDHVAEVFPHLGSPLPSGDLTSEMKEIRKLMREVVKPLIREVELFQWVQKHEKEKTPMEETKFSPWHHFRSQSVD